MVEGGRDRESLGQIPFGYSCPPTAANGTLGAKTIEVFPPPKVPIVDLTPLKLTLMGRRFAAQDFLHMDPDSPWRLVSASFGDVIGVSLAHARSR